MSKMNQNKGYSSSKTKQCLICENYTRQIEEVEQRLAGRDKIISVLQQQLQKCEFNYKKLFDDFEKLRFQHCSALQDNFSLKEINVKLEEFTLKSQSGIKSNNSLQGQENDKDRQTSNATNLQDLNAIENLINNQNETLKRLFQSILDELKICKCDNCDSPPSNPKIEEEYKNVESGDYLAQDPQIKALTAEVEKLSNLVEQYKAENEYMKKLLEGTKSQTISVCGSKQSKQILSLQASKDKPSFSQKVLQNISQTSDKAIAVTNLEDPSIEEKITLLKSTMEEQENQFQICKCTLLDQLNDVSNDNQALSDTLHVITAENRSNLESMANLQQELKTISKEHEAVTDELTRRINDLESQLEESKLNEKRLQEAVQNAQNESTQLEEQLKKATDLNCQIKDCRCDEDVQTKTKIAELECANEDLRKELAEKVLEMGEYEEEYTAVCQKMEILMKMNSDMRVKINSLEDELEEKARGDATDQSETATQVSEMNMPKTQEQIEKLIQDKEYLEEENKRAKEQLKDRAAEIQCLKNSIKDQFETLNILEKENNDLKKDIERCKCESQQETERLQCVVNQSQQQVELLLKEHDEKTSQIQSVANELDSIRKSVTEENNTFIQRIRELEEEREELIKVIEERKDVKECRCETAAFEIEKLKAELCKKQCVILELESNVDKFNATLKQFDQNVQELASENDSFRNEREKYLKEKEMLQNQLKDKITENESIRKLLEQKELVRSKRSNESHILEEENETLRRKIDKLVMDKERLETAMKTENLELQMEVDHIKQDHVRRSSTMSEKMCNLQRAYDEIKNQCAKKCFENEKLKTELENVKKLQQEGVAACECLRRENSKLKNQCRENSEHQYRASEEMDALKETYDRTKKECTQMCMENEELQSKLDEKVQESTRLSRDYDHLRRSQIENETEMTELRQKYEDLKEIYEQKCLELKKLHKQWESCCKQSQISREEYNNLRKEYKEIRSMLSDQIKRYKRDTNSIEANQQKPCKVVSELKKQILEKENQMLSLQQKLKDSSYEIIELKDYVHKLISDNNILKSAINNLIGNLERKIKGPSLGSLPSNSAEAIAGEILQSLTNIETTIIKKSSSCPIKECTCMTEILTNYNVTEPLQGSSKPRGTDCCVECCMKQKLIQRTQQAVSELSTVAPSDPSTTDSEDCQCNNFLDKKSAEFLKQAVEDLRMRKGSTMKEKSCDCEQYLAKQ